MRKFMSNCDADLAAKPFQLVVERERQGGVRECPPLSPSLRVGVLPPLIVSATPHRAQSPDISGSRK